MAHLHHMRVSGWMFGTIKLLFRQINSSLFETARVSQWRHPTLPARY
jgi:hypothetical protein